MQQKIHPYTKRISKVHVFKKGEISYSISEQLKDTFGGISSSSQHLEIPTLPDNTRINSLSKPTSSGPLWSHRIQLDINHQDKSLRKKLDSFNQEQVLCALETTSGDFQIYGNSLQPLTFMYSDADNIDPLQMHGLVCTISGETYFSLREISRIDMYSGDFLAEWLSSWL